jgi:hypothetical protein
MDSEDFFKQYKSKIEHKSGVYVLEHPMKYNGQPIFKIGYAHDSLYTRIRGYKTAYGPIQFKVHCAWNVPEGVFNKRLMTALQTERHLHDLLYSKVVMKNLDNDKKEGEWFYDIKEILYAVLRTRASQIAEVENVENLFFYISDAAGKFTRSNAKNTPSLNPDDQSSKFKGLTMRAPSKRNTPSKKYSQDEFDVEQNKSREKKKILYKARVRTTPS